MNTDGVDVGRRPEGPNTVSDAEGFGDRPDAAGFLAGLPPHVRTTRDDEDRVVEACRES